MKIFSSRTLLCLCGLLPLVAHCFAPLYPRQSLAPPSLSSKSRLYVLPPDLIPHLNYRQPNATSFQTALCVVPPLDKWDRLQRARHVARDPSYHEWPPAIRLFHPFFSDALEVAQVIEDLELEPFTVTLDEWSILPHTEAIAAEWYLQQQYIPESSSDSTYDNGEPLTDDEVVQELIAREEQVGREKNRARKIQRGDALEPEDMDDYTHYASPKEIVEQQQQQYDEFNGPCILCLEPNLESRLYLAELRDGIQEILGHAPYSSPSSVYSWNYTTLGGTQETDYRPIVAVSAFPTVSSAMVVARKLKGLWEPLTFDVKDLHLLSCKDDEEPDGYVMPQTDLQKAPWRCDAKIKLLGEEVDQDEDFNQEMVQQLMDSGTPGGMDISRDFTILDEEEDEGTLEQWLNDDEDFDDGTTVIIGRTHFFTGDQRVYPGMPASSHIDMKDRATGERGTVSGAARRRSTVHRQGSVWEDGEFGRRDGDYSPWSKREKSRRRNIEENFDYNNIERLLDP
jgi:hypothetical protein